MLRRKTQGFSLIELMIVILLVSVISGGVAIVVSSASSPQKRLQEVGAQLFAKMRFASDEALIQRRLIGLRVNSGQEKTQYTWHAYENERWVLLSSPLSITVLPEDMDIEVTVDDELLEALLENSLNSLAEEEQTPPAIIFYPNSDISEFELKVSLKLRNDSDEKFRIYLDERGQLSNSSVDEKNQANKAQ